MRSVVSPGMESLQIADSWPAENVAVTVLSPEGELARRGDASRVFRWASVTKLVTALAASVAAEEGTIDLDEPAGPPGSTMRHLLAHASGLPFDGRADREAGHAPDLLEHRLRGRRRADRATPRCRLPSTCRRPCSNR